MRNQNATDEPLLEALHDIEETIDVISLEYRGVKYWPLLRSRIFFENSIWRRSTGSVPANRLSGIVRRIINTIKSEFEFIYDIRRSARIKKADILTVSYTTSRIKLNNGSWVNRFIDPLLVWAGSHAKVYSFYCEEYAPTYEYRVPRFMSSAYQQRKLNRLSLANSMIGLSDRDRLSNIDIIERIREKLQNSGFTVQCLDINRLSMLLRNFSWHIDRYRRLLKKVRPKIIFIVNYYSIAGYALMHVANTTDCVTVDLQHGAQGPEHIAYLGFRKIPIDGWSIIPRIFWNWTADDVRQINAWGGDNHIGMLGGIIWHQFLNDDFNAFSTYRSHILNLMKSQDKKHIVLVSLQPLQPELEHMDALRKAIESRDLQDVYWLLRLHQSMFDRRSKYIEYFDRKNCNIEFASDAPLPILLMEVDLHVTRSSSVTIEASLLNVPTIMEHGCTIFPEWEQRGMARQLKRDETLVCGIRRALDAGKSGNSGKSKQEGKNLLAFLLGKYLDNPCTTTEEALP